MKTSSVQPKKLKEARTWSDLFGSLQFGSVGFNLVLFGFGLGLAFKRFFCVVLRGVYVKLRKVVGLVTNWGLAGHF